VAATAAAAAAGAAESGLPRQASFAAKPQAAKAGDKVTVAFSVAGPTDAAVEILDAGGKVVRHLGAAALGGKNDPPPPFKAGLAQSVEWDLRDDAGKPARGGPFRARVRLGLSAGFDRFIGWEGAPPMDLATVNGLAVGPDRTVYVISIDTAAPAAGRSENRVWAMSPEGKYLRTLYPYSAKTDPAELRGADFLSAEPGRLEPRVYDRVCPSYLPQMRAVNRQSMACTPEGRLVFANGWATELYAFGPRCIMVMNPDGTIPRERIDGPDFAGGCKSGYAHLALSPDGKTAYVCGMNTARYGKPDNVVYRAALDVGAEPAVIFGKAGQSAGGREGLNDPRGIAVDGKGRVYVSDFGNDRIAVLDPGGKYLGEIPLKGPAVMSVHPKTGAVYAISLVADGKYKLVRIGGFEKPEVTAELDMSRFRGVTRLSSKNYLPVMALDPHGEKPVVYLGSPSSFAAYRILRVVDGGAGLTPEKVDVKSSGKIRGLPYPQGTDGEGNFFFLDQARPMPHGHVIAGWEVRADTGELRAWANSQTYRGAWGRDGHFYRANWYTGKAFSRVDRAGKTVPFSATGEMSESYNEDRFSYVRANLHALASGEVWALYKLAKTPMRVSAFGPDGKIKRREVVKGLQGAASLRVDSRGNIYAADGLKRDGVPYPPEIAEFAARLRAEGTTERGHHGEAVEDAYGEGYGSILKFGPQGGEIRKAGSAANGEALLTAYPHRVKFAAKGLERTYPRISPMSPPRYDYPYSACWCLHAMFDVDGCDRLFVPDALQFKVRVLDANFNEIASFGGYDQATEKGGKANAPGPEIPFEFPSYVHAGGGFVYVTDSASCARRIVRVKLTYRAEETCPVP
jgi:DNA-binding beta-propeller fold protein YncE